MNDLLVLGASGYLGTELCRHGRAAGLAVVGTSFSRRGADIDVTGLDLCDRDAVRTSVERSRPAVVINAAYRQNEWAVTADGAANAASAAASIGARFVQVSTDVVFSGRPVPYLEACPPDPDTAYGAAKAAAETAVRAILPGAVIARTSLIMGPGSAHEERVRDQLASGAGVLFTDDIRCPVHVTDLAAALLELGLDDFSGIFHLAGPDAITRYDAGRRMATAAGLDPAGLRSGRRCDIGLPSPSVIMLDSTRSQAQLRTRLRGALEFLPPAVGSPR